MKEKRKKERKPKGRIIFLIFTLFFCLMLGFFSLCGFFVPDREMSENENRVLTGKPVLTLSGLTDGSFMKNFEDYLSDQFPFRDEAIYIKSFTERLMGKKEENGVYIGKNGFLFDKQTPYNEKQMKALAKKINALKKNNSSLKTVFALVPNSSYIYSENLPDNLELDSQKDQIRSFYSALGKSILKVPTVSALQQQKNEFQVFYKTDHHWTTKGAYSVFLETAKKLGIKVKKDSMKFYTVSKSFEGTLKSKSVIHPATDCVEICIPKKSKGTYYIEFSGNTKKRASFFFENKLKEKNKYEVFLGGNYAKVTVTTTLPEGRKLLVVKDSYANCLIPMLTPYFSKIVIVDPRYMTESISKVLKSDSFTDLLFLYNANTLFSDTSLSTAL